MYFLMEPSAQIYTYTLYRSTILSMSLKISTLLSFLPWWFCLWNGKEQDQPVQCCNLEGLQLHSLNWLASPMDSELHIITNDNAAPLLVQICKPQHQLYICASSSQSHALGGVAFYITSCRIICPEYVVHAGDDKFWEYDNWSGSFWPFMGLQFQHCGHNIPPLKPCATLVEAGKSHP